MNIEYRLAQRLSKRNGFEYTILTGNGTTAIYLLLCALGFRQKKIAIPDNTCLNILMAVLLSGNEPYYLDICLNTGCIDTDKLKSITDPDIAAVIFPYMYGQNIDISDVADICRRKNWVLIEDYAQAFGILANHRYRSGSTAAILSFGSGKIIEAGHGGALQVNSPYFKKRIERKISSNKFLNDNSSDLQLGLSQIYKFIYNNIKLNQFCHFTKVFLELFRVYKKDTLIRFDNMYAKKIILGLDSLEDNISHRLRLSGKFQKLFSRHPRIKCMEFGYGSVPWRFNIFINRQARDYLLKEMLSNRFLVSSWFPPLSYIYPSAEKKFPGKDCILFGDTILNLWVDQHVNDNYCRKVSDFIMKAMN